MKVQIHMKDAAQPIERQAENTYVKEGLFCVYLLTGKVEKYPIENIWRVTEDYS